MSIHSSLKSLGKLRGERNVWTRMERIQALRKIGLWETGDSVVGLPKVRTHFKVKSKKQLKADVPPTTGEGAVAAEGAEKTAGQE